MELNKGALGLAGSMVSRTEPRSTEQRSEPRHSGLVDRAVMVFRGQDYLVNVINISAHGTMVDCDIRPRIGEPVTLQFDNGVRVKADIRWVRDGQVGLSFGQSIVFG